MRMNKGLSHSAETVPSPAKLAAATAVPFTSLLVRSAPITSLIMTQLFLEVSLSLLVPPPYPTSLHFPVQAMMRQGGRGCNAARTRALPVNPTPTPRQYSRPPTRPDHIGSASCGERWGQNG